MIGCNTTPVYIVKLLHKQNIKYIPTVMELVKGSSNGNGRTKENNKKTQNKTRKQKQKQKHKTKK